MDKEQQTYGQGVVFVLVATLGWSLSGIFVRLLPGLDGWQINTWRGLWMAVTLLCYLVGVYGSRVSDVFRAIPLAALLISATFFAMGTTFYVTSLTLASTAVISVIGASAPLFTGLLSPWVTGENPRLSAWISASLAVVGVGIIGWDGLESGKWLGIAVGLFVPISFAGQTLMLRRYRGIDMMPAICLGGFAAFLACGVLGFITGRPGGGFAVEPGEIAILAVMGAIQLTVPLIFYGKGARSVPAITLSLIVVLDAVLNPFWPWLFVGEVPESSAFVGGSIIIGAVLISILGDGLITRNMASKARSRVSA